MAKESLERFLNAVELKQSIDFPFVCLEINLPYSEVEKALHDEPWFKQALKEMLLRMKFRLYQSIMDLAVRGRTINGEKPNLAAVREICDIIESGVLWGEEPAQGKKRDLSPEELKAFGLE